MSLRGDKRQATSDKRNKKPRSDRRPTPVAHDPALRVTCHRSLVTAAVLVLAYAGCEPGGSDWVKLNPPVAAPGFSLPTLDGGRVSLAEQRDKVVVMEFWATWCGPCRFSTPSLDAIYRNFKDRGVTVLLINAGEPPERVRKWAEHRFAAPILLDQQGEAANLYHVEGIPRLFVIDQQGRIIYDHAGYAGGLEFNLGMILKELLANGSVPAQTPHG
ncbi:MAG: TlpA family protein disulfide reductase [Candidatus Omnitrophica bacterium]|nr:TlpA family protein disulfide reductase [Candidatus Omnitrophota bacterium]